MGYFTAKNCTANRLQHKCGDIETQIDMYICTALSCSSGRRLQRLCSAVCSRGAACNVQLQSRCSSSGWALLACGCAAAAEVSRVTVGGETPAETHSSRPN